MNRIPHIFHAIGLLLVSTLFLSCHNEDMASNCFRDIRIYFTYSPLSMNPADVDRMHLYFFNQEGYYVGECSDNNIVRFSTEYYIEYFGLKPGNYRFIAWGGKDERFYTVTPAPFVKGKTTFGEAMLMLEHPGNKITTPIRHLFHSNIYATVTYDQKQHFTMPLTQLSNTINISTVGLPSDENSYVFDIKDNNCTYTFNGSFEPNAHSIFSYTAPCTKDEAGQLHSSLNVLHLAANRRIPQLQIYNQTATKALYPANNQQSGDLIELILSAYKQNDFDTTHTYDIVLTFTGDETTGFDVTVTINGWKVQQQEDDLFS